MKLSLSLRALALVMLLTFSLCLADVTPEMSAAVGEELDTSPSTDKSELQTASNTQKKLFMHRGDIVK